MEKWKLPGGTQALPEAQSQMQSGALTGKQRDRNQDSATPFHFSQAGNHPQIPRKTAHRGFRLALTNSPAKLFGDTLATGQPVWGSPPSQDPGSGPLRRAPRLWVSGQPSPLELKTTAAPPPQPTLHCPSADPETAVATCSYGSFNTYLKKIS